jgi:hypothetical protein
MRAVYAGLRVHSDRCERQWLDKSPSSPRPPQMEKARLAALKNKPPEIFPWIAAVIVGKLKGPSKKFGRPWRKRRRAAPSIASPRRHGSNRRAVPLPEAQSRHFVGCNDSNVPWHSGRIWAVAGSRQVNFIAPTSTPSLNSAGIGLDVWQRRNRCREQRSTSNRWQSGH